MDFDDTVHGDTELRVHGVSGTPPEALLEHPKDLLRRVSGDSNAGFYRRWYPGGTTRDAPHKRHLEAYSWGGLTSGPATRALWLLLLPFTLVNLAHWMLPRAHSRRRFAAGAVRALRLPTARIHRSAGIPDIGRVTSIGRAWTSSGSRRRPDANRPEPNVTSVQFN